MIRARASGDGLKSAVLAITATVRHALAVAAALAVWSGPAPAEDKPWAEVCGDLFGARQTAIRLLQGGWPPSMIVQDAVDRPEWRNAPIAAQKMLMDLLQETFNDPDKPSSEVIRDCMRHAEGAPQGE